jgi:dTDP-glucose pyrophosphorylase
MDSEKIKAFQIQQGASIKEAMLQLTRNGIKILFAVDEAHRLNGTLTDGDIRRGITSGLELSTRVTAIMTREFLCVDASDPRARQRCRELMQQHLVEYVPLIDEERRLADIASWRDYIAADGDQKEVHAPLNYPVVIMAGGKGVRLDPFTKILPKPLIPLGDKPIVEVIMDRFFEQGFHRFKLLIKHKKEMIKLYFSESSLPYEIEMIEEEDYGGTVGGLCLLKGKLDGTFILTNCDTLLEGDYGEFLNWHLHNENILTIIGSHKEVAVPYGVLNMNNGKLIDMVEKPKFDLFVNTGTYVMQPEILAAISHNEAMDIDRLIEKLQRDKANKVGVFPCWGGWFDIGQWDEYRKTLRKMGIES